MDLNIKLKKAKIIESRQLVKDSDYEDMKISCFVIIFYFTQILNLTIKTILPIPESLYPKISMLFGIILFVSFFIAIVYVLKRSFILLFFSEIFWMGIFAISYLMDNAEPSLLLYNLVWVMFVCLPLGICVYSINNKEVLYNMFLKSSFGMTFILSLIFFFSPKDSYYNMSFSYALLVPTIFHINEWLKNGRKICLVFCLAEIIEIIIYGSRGTLVSIAFFFTLYFLFNKKNLIKKISIIIIASFILIAICTNFDKIGSALLKYLSGKGFYSRTLTLLFSDQISYDSGRFEILKYYIDLIAQKPFIGWGVLGGWLEKGLGPHNMIIEILLAFGIIIGGIISLLLVLLQFRIFFIKDRYTHDLMAVYMSICIVLFLISGNYLQNFNLFIFLGLILGSFKDKRLKNRYT